MQLSKYNTYEEIDDKIYIMNLISGTEVTFDKATIMDMRANNFANLSDEEFEILKNRCILVENDGPRAMQRIRKRSFPNERNRFRNKYHYIDLFNKINLTLKDKPVIIHIELKPTTVDIAHEIINHFDWLIKKKDNILVHINPSINTKAITLDYYYLKRVKSLIELCYEMGLEHIVGNPTYFKNSCLSEGREMYQIDLSNYYSGVFIGDSYIL
ncbi:MAG: hypothetical protein PF505_02245 [Vallitaleaceae bacterium]|jgi:hypothetical protein|nr:hypothetical protein [Vallitaleaceae bacterium]